MLQDFARNQSLFESELGKMGKSIKELKSTFSTNVSQRNPLNRTSEEKLKEIETIILSGGNLGIKML
jgi:hypothetical protein